MQKLIAHIQVQPQDEKIEQLIKAVAIKLEDHTVEDHTEEGHTQAEEDYTVDAKVASALVVQEMPGSVSNNYTTIRPC